MPAPRASALDWGVGSYERTADQLLPAARALVDRAAPGQGDRVVDVGCGSGNAALLAAARGADVVGVDPSPRLLEVARRAAAEQGLTADFVEGDAASLPLGDGEAELVISVFGVIFAPDPEAAAAEMARVSAPGGRFLLTAWIPDGTLPQVVRATREALGRALDRPPPSPPFAWQDPQALDSLLRPHGFEATVDEQRIAFTASSPAAFLDAQFADHPLWVAARAALGPRGELEGLRQRSLEILAAGNEDPAAFRVTSRYVIATATRAQPA